MSNPKITRSTGTILSDKLNMAKKGKKRMLNVKRSSTSNVTSGSKRSLNRCLSSSKTSNYAIERLMGSDRSPSETNGNSSRNSRESGSGGGKNTIDNDLPEITTRFLDETYCEVLNKFNRLKDRIAGSQTECRRDENNSQNACTCSKGAERTESIKIGGADCDYIEETVIKRSMLVGNGVQTTSKHIIKRCDKSGNVELEINDSNQDNGKKDIAATVTNTAYYDKMGEPRYTNVPRLRQHDVASLKAKYVTNQNFEQIAANSRSQYANEQAQVESEYETIPFSSLIASEPSSTTLASVKIKTSFTKMRQKPKSGNFQMLDNHLIPMAARSNSPGGRVHYQIDNTDMNSAGKPIASSAGTIFSGVDHNPLQCCRCICDICSSNIAQQFLLNRLNRQTLNDLVSQNKIGGRQRADYYHAGEGLGHAADKRRVAISTQHQEKFGRTQLDECVLPPHCYSQEGTPPRTDFLRDRYRPANVHRSSLQSTVPKYGPRESLPSEQLERMFVSPYQSRNLADFTASQRYPDDALAGRLFYQRGSKQISGYQDEAAQYRSTRQSAREQAYHSERIAEISEPSYYTPISSKQPKGRSDFESVPRESYRTHGVSGQKRLSISPFVEGPGYPSEQTADVTAPSFQKPPPGVPTSSIQRAAHKIDSSELIDDTSTPLYQSPQAGISTGPPHIDNGRSYPGEQIADISAPSYKSPSPGISTAPPHREEDKSYPNERIADESAPSYQSPQSSISTGPPYRDEDKSYPSERIADVSAPTYRSPTKRNSTGTGFRDEDKSYASEQIADISVTSYQSPQPGISTGPPYRDEDKTYPSEQIAIVSAPSYQSPEPDISTRKPYRGENKSNPSEPIADVSAPAYQSSHPAYRNPPQGISTVSHYTTEGRRYSSDRIAENSPLTYQSPPQGIPIRSPYAPHDRSYPSERIADVSAPAYQTPPPGISTASPYAPNYKSYPSERIADESAPSYPTPPPGISAGLPYAHHYRSYPSERIADVSAPAYQTPSVGISTGSPHPHYDRSYPSERIADVSAPLYQTQPPGSSPGSPYAPHDRSYPIERIADISAPIYQSPQPGFSTSTPYRPADRVYPNKGMADVSAPAYRSLPQGISTTSPNSTQDRNYPSERIADISAPAYQGSPQAFPHISPYPAESKNVPAPTFQRPPSSFPTNTPNESRSYPGERFVDISVPVYQSPPPRSSTGTPYRAEDGSYPVQRSAEVPTQGYLTAPRAYSTGLPYGAYDRSYPDNRFSNVATPAYQNLPPGAPIRSEYKSVGRSYPNEQITDYSTLTYQSLTPGSSDRPVYQNIPPRPSIGPAYKAEDKTYRGERAADMSAPSYQRPTRASLYKSVYRPEGRTFPGRRIADMSTTANQNVPPSARSSDSYPNDRNGGVSTPPYRSKKPDSSTKTVDETKPARRRIFRPSATTSNDQKAPSSTKKLPEGKGKDKTSEISSTSKEKIADISSPEQTDGTKPSPPSASRESSKHKTIVSSSDTQVSKSSSQQMIAIEAIIPECIPTNAQQSTATVILIPNNYNCQIPLTCPRTRGNWCHHRTRNSRSCPAICCEPICTQVVNPCCSCQKESNSD